jgi:hypothetical protein
LQIWKEGKGKGQGPNSETDFARVTTNRSAEEFLHMTEEELKNRFKESLPFSMNVVFVDLEGPDLAD